MKDKLKELKWEKGFLRLWAVCSCIWVLLMTWIWFAEGGDGEFNLFLITSFGFPIGILIFVYVAKSLIKFIIDGFK